MQSYTSRPAYQRALRQAARYGRRLGLQEITLAFFVEEIDDENRAQYEVAYVDEESSVTVRPVFITTG